MAKSLRKMDAAEFARRLCDASQQRDTRFAFFLGAGCSVSSGIPSAGTLVKEHWLPQLHQLTAPAEPNLHAWVEQQFPDYDATRPAASYGAVIRTRFPQPAERQSEIEHLCDGRYPGFGYAMLAMLVARDSGHFNVVLTTNFDDLMADALYLYTEVRPLVIHHESLAPFIRPTRTRPLIVKLHGDQRLTPANTEGETAALKQEMQRQVPTVLHDRGLIFLGYGGNDVGICKMLADLPAEALPWGVWWVAGREPTGVIRAWLESRDAFWVDKREFDETMLLMRDAFKLSHPDANRFEKVFQSYQSTYEALSSRIMQSHGPDATALKEAVKRTDESFSDGWAVISQAGRLAEEDPDAAETLYESGLQAFPRFALLLSRFALFQARVRQDHVRAGVLFAQALAVDPGNARVLGDDAWFLHSMAHDPDQAEQLYLRAIAADPTDAKNLANYAVLLQAVRRDFEAAEEYYRRALTANPNHQTSLANLTGVLLAQGKRPEGLDALQRALHHPGGLPPHLTISCLFYLLTYGPLAQREEGLGHLKRLVAAGRRTPGWDLSPHVQRAHQDDHPDHAWLKTLAAVLSDGADVALLDGWAAWAKA